MRGLGGHISRVFACVVLLVMPLMALPATLEKPSELLALCYHDVVDGKAETLTDRLAVTTDTLVQHFSWLASNGYQPITIDQWRAAAHGGALPNKPVLLTFDDGYVSFLTRVVPLLELYGFPAVLAPVTSWMDTPLDQPVQYGDELRPRGDFLTWTQIRDAMRSGLVEVASHSHDMHRGVLANPQGNELPAAAAHAWLPREVRYETDAEYQARIGADLQRSVTLLKQQVELPPRVMVWPYGAHNEQANEVARRVDMPLTMTLDSLPNRVGDPVIHRQLVSAETDLAALLNLAEASFGERAQKQAPLRAAHVDLDYVYDADPAQMRANLDLLLDRIKAMQINAVFLQAFADPDGDGVASELYFPNRHLPVRADLFNRVAWQLSSRAQVQVYAWMPVLAFDLPDDERNTALAVRSSDGSHESRYHRLSPYNPAARQIISEIYDDLGRSSRFHGVLFHDDAFLTDKEDVSAAAVEAAADGMSAERKTDDLIAFTRQLAQILRAWQPGLKTARNLYARVVREPHSEQWFAQNYGAFLDAYDYTAVMAMPYMEEARAPRRWLKELVAHAARQHPDALARTVFHLQSVDWRTGKPISNRKLRGKIDLLLRRGARNIAYYPDDFLRNHPDLHMLRSRLSINAHPALKE